MQDHAQQIRAALIADTPVETPLDIKRTKAIAYLGASYVLHPEYRFRERHALNPARWAPHGVLRPIHLAAAQAGRI